KAFNDEVKLKQLSINKIGHGLFHEPVFKNLYDSGKLLSMLVLLGYKSPTIIQPNDNSFLYTNPISCTWLWLDLKDATVVNGCLWDTPGSHKSSLEMRMGFILIVRQQTMIKKEFISIEVKVGSLVVIHGDLMHQRLFLHINFSPYFISVMMNNNFENQSSKSRHALSLHVVDTKIMYGPQITVQLCIVCVIQGYVSSQYED
ncbi:hypothetical protein MKX01_015574, partial [Papaver californicum]